MTAAAALARLDAAGVRVRLRDDGLLTLTAAGPPPPDVLALARAHRDGIASLLARRAQQAARTGFVQDSPTEPLPLVPARTGFVPVADPPGVPLDWCRGVSLLATRTAPPMILPGRWAVLATTSERTLREHGAALHGAGWPALALFGLDRSAPASYPPGWGLVWLLGEHGEVLDISAGVIWLRWKPDGARMAFYRQHGTGRAGTVLAWLL